MKKSGISRRRFIEYTGAAGLGIGLSSVLPQSSLAKTGIKVASGAANPLGLAANTQAEGVFFSGGFGHAYIEYAAEILQKSNQSAACRWKEYRELVNAYGPESSQGILQT